MIMMMMIRMMIPLFMKSELRHSDDLTMTMTFVDDSRLDEDDDNDDGLCDDDDGSGDDACLRQDSLMQRTL